MHTHLRTECTLDNSKCNHSVRVFRPGSKQPKLVCWLVNLLRTQAEITIIDSAQHKSARKTYFRLKCCSFIRCKKYIPEVNLWRKSLMLPGDPFEFLFGNIVDTFLCVRVILCDLWSFLLFSSVGSKSVKKFAWFDMKERERVWVREMESKGCALWLWFTLWLWCFHCKSYSRLGCTL